MSVQRKGVMYPTARKYVAAYPLDHRYRTTERGRRILEAVLRAAYGVTPAYARRLVQGDRKAKRHD